MPDASTYTIADLARLSGLNVRTIRYYLAQGLIPATGESGPGAHYGQGHLDRLLLTKRLQAQHLPLAEIRSRLEQLPDDDVAALIASSEAQPAGPVTSALEYVRSILGGGSSPSRSLAAGSVAGSVSPSPDASSLPAWPPGPPPPGMVVAVPFAAHESLAEAPTAQASIAEDAAVHHSATPGATPSRAVHPATRLELQRRRLLRSPIPVPTEVAPRAQQAARDIEVRHLPDVPNPERSQWERLSLGPNIELHVRRPLSRIEQRRVERLITIARQVLRDDRA